LSVVLLVDEMAGQMVVLTDVSLVVSTVVKTDKRTAAL
jgi:hypothetical protein